ncbi:MAG: hypothetical protein V2A67_04120 [Bacteroidota bacterium]
MATIMIGKDTPDDTFLSELIKNSEPEKPPSDLQESIMQQILATKISKTISVFNPPKWIKWGVPSIALICSLVLLFLPNRGRQPFQLPDLPDLESLGTINDSWFTGLFKTIELPEFSLPDYAVWLCIGAAVLFWAFIALNRYLEKRFSH